MEIDLKQYIIGILHNDCNVSIEDIDFTKVESILLAMQEDKTQRNSESVRSLYFDDKVAETPVATSEAPATDLPQEKVEEIIPAAKKDVDVANQQTLSNTVSSASNSQNNYGLSARLVHLPNGKVNEEYSESLPIQNIGIDNIEVIAVEGAEEIGLSLDLESLKLKGIPKSSGDFTIILQFKISGDDSGKPILQRQFALYINPDPKSLWTEHEPEADSPFPKSHTAHLELHYADKKVIAASKRGRSHAKDGKFRDDHFKVLHETESDWLMLAVSDGAGSAKFSREGSKIFCETVTSEISSPANRKHFDDLERIISQGGFESKEREVKTVLYYLIGESLLKAFKEVEETAKSSNAVIKDFSCTFMLALCKKISNKWYFAGYWVGDGGIGVCIKDQDPLIFGQPDSGEFSGQTRFITMPEMLNTSEEIFNRIKIAEVEDFEYLALMTDGITDAWFHTDANLFRKEKWQMVWNEISNNQTLNEPYSSSALLEWLDFWVKGEYDDRTIVILS